MSDFLAFDLGAESGRAMHGALVEGRLQLTELHRFLNEPVRLPTGLYWDTLRLFHEICRGLTIAGRERNLTLAGVSVDTWGVDFGLIGEDGALVDNPRHYRDTRTQGVMDKAFSIVPRDEVFAQTGIQFMPFNSLYQWHSMRLAGSPALETARTLLFMPDLFHYWLTGVAKTELTIASTSQFYDPRAADWARPMLDRLGLNAGLLPEVVTPGTDLGPLLPAVAEMAGLRPETTVYAGAGHDTAAAVAAVPAEGDDWCYISSGTWSLMGVEIDAPVIDEHSLALNYTNELGVGGKVRLLKNIAGLWLVQECRRAWAAAGREYNYAQLMEEAAAAGPQEARIDPDAFLEPGRMPEKIAAHCRECGGPIPEGAGAITRVILESLARRYAQVLDSLEQLTGRQIRHVHIVGGGSQNRLLNQLAADATGRTVIAGPVEATAAGNILTQAIGAGRLRDLAEARAVVRQSFPVEVYEPRAARPAASRA